MKVSLGMRGGRVVRSLGVSTDDAEVLEPAEAEQAPPVAVVEPPEEVSPAERWERMIDELDDEETQEPAPLVAGAPSSSSFTILRLAAEEVEAARLREEDVRRREALAQDERSRQDRGMLREVLSALSQFASKPAGDTNITMPATELHPHVTIHEPSITVEPADVRPPDVNVTVEAARVEVPAPQVTVEAALPAPIEVRPEFHVEAAQPPDVHVTVEAPPRPTSVRIEVDDDGTRRFIPEDEEEFVDE